MEIALLCIACLAGFMFVTVIACALYACVALWVMGIQSVLQLLRGHQ